MVYKVLIKSIHWCFDKTNQTKGSRYGLLKTFYETKITKIIISITMRRCSKQLNPQRVLSVVARYLK